MAAVSHLHNAWWCGYIAPLECEDKPSSCLAYFLMCVDCVCGVCIKVVFFTTTQHDLLMLTAHCTLGLVAFMQM